MATDSDRDKMSGQNQPNRDRGRAKEQGRAGGGSQPGVLGDETEEQNLNQPGNPDARISHKDVEDAFRQQDGTGSGSKNPTR